jgi:hypothetical protein
MTSTAAFDVESVCAEVSMHNTLEIIQEHITAADLPQNL